MLVILVFYFDILRFSYPAFWFSYSKIGACQVFLYLRRRLKRADRPDLLSVFLKINCCSNILETSECACFPNGERALIAIF